jgi:hypothetical protein
MGRPDMHLFRALTIQFVAWVVAVFALRYTVTPPGGLLSIVIMQAGIAAALALAMGAPRWWVAIHLVFSPLVVGARALDISPFWYLLAFLGLSAVFWSTFRTRVPLFLTNQATARSLLRAAAAGQVECIWSIWAAVPENCCDGWRCRVRTVGSPASRMRRCPG